MLRSNLLIMFFFCTIFYDNTQASYFSDQAKSLGFSFGGNIEVRKNQKSDLEKTLVDYKKRFEESGKTITAAINKITSDLSAAQQKLNEASEQEADYINKKISILHDRRQNFIDFYELWKETIQYLELQIKLIDDSVEFFQTAHHELKPTYSWTDLRDAQIRTAETVVKIDGFKAKRDNAKKQRIAAQGRLSSLEKQHEVKNKEQEKLIAQHESAESKLLINSSALKLEGDILSQELAALQEKIEHTKLLVEKLDIEIKYRDDLIEFENNKLNLQKQLLTQIENRVVFDYNDVESAKNEWKSEAQKTLTLKEEFNQYREPKKQAKEKLTLELERIRQQLALLKTKGVKDRAGYMLLKAQSKRLTALEQSLDKELQLLDAKKDLAETISNEKELAFNMVELRYKLKIEADNIDVLLRMFQNKRELALGALKAFKDKQNEAITLLIETNRTIEKTKSAQEKLTQKKGPLYKGREHILHSTYNVFDETIDRLNLNLGLTQAFLAVNADLVSHQEKIINQYDLIIHELEIRHKIHGIWQRSPQAISIEALSQSLLEGESFFKKLYWETPQQFKPSTIITTITSWHFGEWLFIFAFFILFLFSFFFVRTLLTKIKNRLQPVIETYQGRTLYLYLHLGITLVNFSLKHFGVLFTWLFIFLHIITDFSYIFLTRPFLDHGYIISVFYLISIPILVYLSHQFIEELKELNKQLSFFFFAETFQDKFIILVTIFCYATAILLPLRLSILAYTEDAYSEFATVILAAYSLILLIVVAFLFTKEDVLKLIPSNTTFLIWLKRKIDKHYYPVFLFGICLLILANPYIGYSNMAWFLAFAAPSSIFLLYLLFTAHYYIRKYAVFLFMKEEDEEIIDKFEHAKAYYGFFVIFSFIILLFVTSILALRIWGLDYTPTDLWNLLAKQWVIPLAGDAQIGFVELMTVGIFITSGLLASSLIHKFILNKLFEILRSEPGTQNTISRIIHYTTISLFIVLGLNAINLQQYVFWALIAPVSIVFGLAIKDIVFDFVAGFFVLIERPIEIGNYIEIDNVQGTVHKISARSTTIITSRNHSIIIPNKDLVMKWITNWGHGRFAVGFEINIRVEHGSDPELVKRILITIIQANPLVLKVPGVVVRLENIEENGLYFLTRAFISARRVREQWELAAALRMEMLKAFKDQHIAFAKPARVMEFKRDNSPSAIEIKFDR